MKLYLWLDVNDKDTVIIGDIARWTSRELKKELERCTAWTSCHVDGISDMFGGDVMDSVKALKAQPAGTMVEVQLAILRVNGEDVSGCETASHQLTSVTNATNNPDLVNVCQWMEDLGI